MKDFTKHGNAFYKKKRDTLAEALEQAGMTKEDYVKAMICELTSEDVEDTPYSKTHKHKLCRGIANYVFRNGPVEGMHADGKLSQEDMKVLNKFMMNKLGELYDIFVNAEISVVNLQWFLDCCDHFGGNWDNFDEKEVNEDCML